MRIIGRRLSQITIDSLLFILEDLFLNSSVLIIMYLEPNQKNTKKFLGILHL